MNLTPGGGQSADHAGPAQISEDGHSVAYISYASDLVAGDSGAHPDVFVTDRRTGATERVSVSSDEVEGNGAVESSSISSDGRYVAFGSRATNLVPGDDNRTIDVFVRDRATGTTERIEIDDLRTDPEDVPESFPDEYRGFAFARKPAISGDGRIVAFFASTPFFKGRILVHDRATGRTKVLFHPDGKDGTTTNFGQINSSSFHDPAISSDGSTVVFTGIRSGSGPNQVFAWDGSSIELVNVTPSGGESQADGRFASVSADGRRVAFESTGTDLAPGDTNDRADVFVSDLETGQTQLVSRRSDGSQFTHGSRGGIGPSGRTVVFENASFIFLRDLGAGTTEHVDQPLPGRISPGGSSLAIPAPQSVSGDDRFVAFSSVSAVLVENDTNERSDIFVLDRGAPPEVSIGDDGGPEDGGPLSFNVSLAEAAPADITLDYETSDGTASAGSDYEATSGSITVPAGAMGATITVPLAADQAVEPDETLTLTLSEPRGARAVLADSTATGTIENDDQHPPCTAVDQGLNLVRGLLGQPPVRCSPA